MVWSEIDVQSARQVQVTVPDRTSLLDDLGQHMAQGRGFALATLNLDHVVKLRQSPDFRLAYLAQSHVTADGNPIVWLCRLAGQRVALIPGSELIMPLAEVAAAQRVPVALVGSTQNTLALAAQRLKQRIPGLEVVLQLAPPMGFDPTGAGADAVIAAIDNSGAGLCFLALGAPKQEMLAARAYAALPGVGFVSIGAGLDFIAGHQRRAPRLVRMLAAEWLWRLAGNPRRLAARYGACLWALPGLTVKAIRVRG
ncbi:MAG: WecB/TagA/CpsF family glycosyltransferase [Yoonia sp.]|nr:WecB/TagA/CpsF family glycosyltransferase [Yoonia sp.]MBE0414693.1 WecB/TagA/CpsF family glycosyltransferase [Yoonia sp.]